MSNNMTGKRASKDEALTATTQLLYDVNNHDNWDTSDPKEWEQLQNDVMTILIYLIKKEKR